MSELVMLVVFILVFLALREVMCWYYKINKAIELMQEQNNLLKRILAKQGGEESNVA